MVVALVDDHRLLTLLTAEQPPSGRYATTCSWWWRLTSAFAGHRAGTLTGRLTALEAPMAHAIRRTLRNLPHHLEIVDLRTLVPAMGALAEAHSVNQLAAEAVAVAAYLDTPIEVEVDAPQLRLAARSEQVSYRVVG